MKWRAYGSAGLVTWAAGTNTVQTTPAATLTQRDRASGWRYRPVRLWWANGSGGTHSTHGGQVVTVTRRGSVIAGSYPVQNAMGAGVGVPEMADTPDAWGALTEPMSVVWTDDGSWAALAYVLGVEWEVDDGR